ncbi:polysaccharide biosynthesis tyrosine autokinase [Pilimelia columellifera]|uniref:Polysaccharide biosynthesis tyrosine autokinase n=1 Tax=Pilimelia columellifera subsp. columellifera TaxID=706583 RepID=A0ABP6AZK4_9ACTN
MELPDLLRAVRKRWWWVLGALSATLSLAAVVTVNTTPRYATSLTFFVSTPNSGVGAAYEGGLFTQQRVKSYASLLASDRLARLVAGTAGAGLDAERVRQRITATAKPETVLLDAVVVDESRQRSLALATSLARHFSTLVEELETPPGQSRSAVKVELVVGPALDPTPVAPRRVRNLALAALLGVLIGAGCAALREILDTTIKTSDGLRDLVGAPVLASVPFDQAARDTPQRLVTHAGHSPRAEALRQLRTNLQFVDIDRPVRTLAVTSAVSGEGKSSTACNLAILFTEAGKRVLLIDADLRRPRIAEYLGIEGAVGLTTVLAGQAELGDVLQPWGAGLWVLPSGFLPPNPSELLGSEHMSDLLRHFRDQFDMVIVDCPPLLPVTDGAIAAARADGALLVTRARRTTAAQVAAAAAAVRSVDARLLGCVLNMVTPGDGDPYQYYGYDAGAPDRRKGHHRSGAGPADRFGARPEPVSAGQDR